MRKEKKYIKMIDNEICNRKIEFQAKSGTMKMKKNYRKIERVFYKKIWRVFKCKEIFTP